MTLGLTLFFLCFALVDALLVASIIYHLRAYTLPNWHAPAIVIPLYVSVSVIFLGIATYFFFQII